jgi:CBS domain-containing protein
MIKLLRDVMRPTLSIGPNESIRTAAERMADANLPVISVMEEGRVVGLLSNRDLVGKAVARSLSADDTKVSVVMNSRPVRISDDRDVPSALLVMQARGVHELLVQDFTGQVVGVFCDSDCCELEAK